MRKYRAMYFGSSVPTETRNSAYELHIQNTLRGWSLKNPRVSVRGMRHLLNMYGLDVGLKCVGSPSTRIGRGQKERTQVNNMDLGNCMYCDTCACSKLAKGSEKSF